MRSSTALALAGAGLCIVTLGGLAVACDPHNGYASDSSVVVVHDHGPHTSVHVHGCTCGGRRTTTHTRTRTSTSRRTGSTTTRRSTVTITKRR